MMWHNLPTDRHESKDIPYLTSRSIHQPTTDAWARHWDSQTSSDQPTQWNMTSINGSYFKPLKLEVICYATYFNWYTFCQSSSLPPWNFSHPSYWPRQNISLASLCSRIAPFLLLQLFLRALFPYNPSCIFLLFHWLQPTCYCPP